MKTILITLTLVLALAGSASAGFLDFWNYGNYTWGQGQLHISPSGYSFLLLSNGDYCQLSNSDFILVISP